MANAGDFSVLSLWSSSALEGEGIVAGAAAAGGAGFFHKPRSPKQASVKEDIRFHLSRWKDSISRKARTKFRAPDTAIERTSANGSYTEGDPESR